MLDTSQINVDNAPVELKCALFDFHEILECRFEKARKDRASRKREYEIDSPEYLEKLEEMFSKTQQIIHSGKAHSDASRFNGNPQTGKTTFAAIANSLSASDKENFHF
ncbi:6784_t:CDS:2 [Entrophospora sp. SA101]|nr:6784_t:CDS:2 [Entrophospora sp. SA101]CAJ0913733.1 12890_t:CDS:2 [Entrophospora sp. SA101]